ncbi:PREDICTED: melanoma-associated antigen B1-like [Elephantulus edwardii]|uniref:melanoma-associated antigen B1-like n=1 Tax=Elephantulus edwardii TaxID=28737 RepID=UPI0003F09C11|nr:PREDICTED: melanoma-associated antigen B1-like [Elephantulus edwardii]
MPRGQKSKLRAEEKRRQARRQNQGPQGAQASPELSPEPEGTPQSSSTAGSPQEPAPGPSTQGAALAGGAAQTEGGHRSQPRARKEEKNGADEGPSSENTASSSKSRDPLNTRSCLLMQLMLRKYKMDEFITKEEMLKTITRKYRKQFPEILKVTTKRLELAFGIYLEEQHPCGHVYSLVCKLNLPSNPTTRGQRELPKTGLLMPLLGMIFINGNRATEKELWEFLNKLGVYVGEEHLIFGEPKKLVSNFVQAKYLVHRLLAGSCPPRFKFRWGPRAYAEVSKMEVLEFLTKTNSTNPSDFTAEYQEALAEQQERARDKGAAEVGPAAPGKAKAKAKGAGASTP